jgi:hypothetical protein
MNFSIKLVPDDLQKTIEVPFLNSPNPKTSLLALLKTIKSAFPGLGSNQKMTVFMKSTENGVFVFIAKYPLEENKDREMELTKFIEPIILKVSIKVQRVIDTVAMCLASETCFSQDHLMTRTNKAQNFELENEFDEKTRKRRNKERRIGFIIKKVKEWRSLYADNSKGLSKTNLYDAANMVGISKKSLDDYWMQLK